MGPMIDQVAFRHAAEEVVGRRVSRRSSRLLQTLFESHVDLLVHYARRLSGNQVPGRQDSDDYEVLVRQWLGFELDGRHLRMAAVLPYNLRLMSPHITSGR